MIVVTTSPGVSLGDATLAVFPVGVPIGLGIYWAWVHRDWSPRTSIAGFGAAAGGSLVGAWLGFSATAGLLALITTIVGAAVGANLALITSTSHGTGRVVLATSMGEPVASRCRHRRRSLSVFAPEPSVHGREPLSRGSLPHAPRSGWAIQRYDLDQP